MILTYSGASRLSAQAIADESNDIGLNRGYRGKVNWGRNEADTELNPDISNSTNKRVMRELFASHNVPMPYLYSEEQVRQMYADSRSDLPYAFVGRPDTHMKGRGFWLVRSRGSLDNAIRGTRRKRAATHFMEYIEADREYRVHIFKGKSIRISEKEFFTDENGKRDYVTIRPDRPVRKVREAAKQAVEALGLDFGAVDVLARGDSNNEVFVLEVNAAPGLGGSMPRLYAETFLSWERGEW